MRKSHKNMEGLMGSLAVDWHPPLQLSPTDNIFQLFMTNIIASRNIPLLFVQHCICISSSCRLAQHMDCWDPPPHSRLGRSFAGMLAPRKACVVSGVSSHFDTYWFFSLSDGEFAVSFCLLISLL